MDKTPEIEIEKLFDSRWIPGYVSNNELKDYLNCCSQTFEFQVEGLKLEVEKFTVENIDENADAKLKINLITKL